MLSRRSRRYWRRMFEGETGDYVKNILTDGQWKPKDEPAPIAFKIVLTIFLIILVGAVGFGAWKVLVWIW